MLLFENLGVEQLRVRHEDRRDVRLRHHEHARAAVQARVAVFPPVNDAGDEIGRQHDSQDLDQQHRSSKGKPSHDGARSFEIASAREANTHLVVTLKGVTSRDEAERLNGVELYVPRDRLPPTDDGEYYHADLIGLAAVTSAGDAFGRVVAIHNFGAGDIIEIAPPDGGPTRLLPFTDAVVPTVDLAAGQVVIEPPNEIEGDTPNHPEA